MNPFGEMAAVQHGRDRASSKQQRSIKNKMAPATMSHASLLTQQACALFAGPNAVKRMAQAIGCSVGACKDYFGGRRRLSLDAAIELAGRNDAALAALLRQVQEVRERNAGMKLPALYVTDPASSRRELREAGTCCAVSAEPRA